MLAGQLGGQPVDVVVVPVHGDERAAVHGGREDLLLLEVRRDQHHGPDAGPGRRRGDRVGQVAGRRAGEDLEAHLGRRRERHGDDPVLEGVGRVAAVVLDPQAPHPELGGEPVGADQPGVAGLGGRAARDVPRDRQQRGVAPDVLRARLDVGPGQPREVVADLQRPETLRARVERAERAGGAALTAGQAGGVAKTGAFDSVAERASVSAVMGARPLSPIFPSGHPDHRPDLAPGRALALSAY